MQVAGMTWEWSRTWSEIMGMGGFDASAANRGAYAGLMQGIATCPNQMPQHAHSRSTPTSDHPQASAWAWLFSLLLSRWRGFFFGGLVGGAWGPWRGGPPTAAAGGGGGIVAAAILPTAFAHLLPHPHPTPGPQVIPPPPAPSRLSPTQPVQHQDRQVGVTPERAPKLRDPP